MEVTQMSVGMNKEVVVHRHNKMLLSYKKEHIWVSSNEVYETGADLQSEVRKRNTNTVY